MLLNETNLLLVEERDTVKQEVHFHCFNIESGKQILKDLTLDDKFWVGIEAFEGDIIYFHRYVKPDMPWHKGIIAYSVPLKKILWENPDANFAFLLSNKIYVTQQLFESTKYYALAPETGNLVEDVEIDSSRFKSLKEEFKQSKDYSDYKFPDFYAPEIHEALFKNAAVAVPDSSEQVELIEYDNLLIYSNHRANKKGEIDHVLYVLDNLSKKTIFSEVINRNEKSRIFDSFFVFKHYLVVIKDKIELMVFQLI